MRSIRARWMGLALILLLALLMVPVFAEEAAGAVAPHNYILLVDNSRSTTGRHSLGTATDPSGLRFDAARLVYQNVVTSAAAGAKGKLGVVVFCGTKNCVSYGPLDIDAPEIDQAIGGKLNAEANAGRRDDFTDIRTALQTAKDMLEGFDGDTSVLLLTDGVNDLTNRSDPFARPENIEVNEQSVALARELREAGADLYIIALTADENVDRDADFMTFIDRLAEAGGGEAGEDGSFGNVLLATQSDLNSKLLQMLIRAESESTPEAIQTIVEYTPVNEPFTVPYDGITDATVNITFMPEDKPLLERVELVAPDGVSRTLWDGDGIHEGGGITVTEDRSYIMLAIPEPQAGDWNVVVTSQKTEDGDSRVLINAVVRFNHNLRVNVEMDSAAAVGEDIRINAWFRKFNGEAFEDLTDSDIYAQSSARLTLTTPGGNEKSIAMKREGERYTVVFKAKTAGAWRALLQIRNPYVQETSDEIEFEVAETQAPRPAAELTPEPTPVLTPEPTPEPEPAGDDTFGLTPEGAPDAEPTPTPEPTFTPTPSPTPEPTPTPIPTVVPIERLTLSVEPSVTAETGEIFLSGNTAKFSWQLEGEAESVQAALVEGDTSLSIFAPGFSIPRSFFQEGRTYTFRVTAMPRNGRLNGAEPTVETLTFRTMPRPIGADEISLAVEPVVPDADEALYVDRNAERVTVSWDIARATDAVEAEVTRDGETWLTGLRSGDTIDREALEDGAAYALVVSALPSDGALAGVEPTVKSLNFALYPPAQPIQGLTLNLSNGAMKGDVGRVKGRRAELYWLRESGVVDHYLFEVTDASGKPVLMETLDGRLSEYIVSLPKEGDYDVTLTAAPRYDIEGTGQVTAVLKLHAMSLLEQYWYFAAGAAALLAAGVTALVLAIKKKKGRRKAGK